MKSTQNINAEKVTGRYNWFDFQINIMYMLLMNNIITILYALQ